MNREQAFEVAKQYQAEHSKLAIERFFSGGSFEALDAVAAERFGYRHGWYLVDGHSFSEHEITGTPYDMHQGGWAYL